MMFNPVMSENSAYRFLSTLVRILPIVLLLPGTALPSASVTLTTFPLRTEDIGRISPLGAMVHGHVTPSNHLGISPVDPDVPPDHYDVLAPADGLIVCVQRSPKGNPDPGVRGRRYTGEYLVVFEHTGTFYTRIGLIERLDSAVIDELGGEPRPGPPVMTRISVKAGQVIGKMGGGHGLDFAVVNTDVTLKGFVNPDQFRNRDPFKAHVVDPFDYIDEPLRGKLLALNPRKVEPFGGRIDYDVDGRLAGNWYREGMGGYAGFRKQLDYWVGHLTFAYHHIDPSKITISIGDFEGAPRQFWVKGNAPDPADVSPDSGPVIYELIWMKLGGDGRRFQRHDMDRIHGVVLAELIEDRKLKVEFFPGLAARDVAGFTSAARLYTR